MAHLGVLGTVTGHMQRSIAKSNVVRVAQTKGVAAQAEVTPTAPCSTSSLAICGVRMALQWGRQTWRRAMQVSSTASKGWRRGSKQNWAHPLPPAVEPRGGPRRAGAGGNFLCLMASLFLFK